LVQRASFFIRFSLLHLARSRFHSRMHRFFTIAAVSLFLASSIFAEESEQICHQHFGAPVPFDRSDSRKYAPSRDADLLHLAIDVTPDFKERTIAAKCTVRFKPIARPLTELQLDAVDLSVSDVQSSANLAGHQNTGEKIILTFDPAIPAGKETTVTITYSAEPKQGLYFRTPEMGYKAQDTHLWTQGETTEARNWFPSIDHPNEKFTSEVTCHVPTGMVVLSNGRQVSEEKEASGLTAVRWLQDKPHANYLIALCAGNFKKVEDKYRNIPLAFYVPASQIDHAANSFAPDTKDSMAFFEKEIGVPYPWAKYYQVCVNDFGWGGMENTSLTVLNDNTLHTDASETLHDSQGLIAHELAHQWFGDLVTCKDWANVWLNEGFATYYEKLYENHKNGRDHFLYGMLQSAKGIVGQTNQTTPMVRRDYKVAEEQFNFLAYPKGSWILHMLRSEVGDDLYRRAIKTYLERHQFANVTTEDLKAVFEELSGRSFDQFFDQYVYHAGHPELAVSYSWDEKAKLAKVTVQQTQRVNDDVMLFNVPLTIRFKNKSGQQDRTITVKEKAEDFYFALPAAPEIVRIDPEYHLLAKISFAPPSAMINAMVADKSDMLGRLLAIDELGKRKDTETVNRLKQLLNEDAFYGVRSAAAQALRSIHTDAAFKALTASTKQSDARVRREVISEIGSFYRDDAFEVASKTLEKEKNPEIRSSALASLGGYAKKEARALLLQQLTTDSYRNLLTESAIAAMRTQNDPDYINPILGCLQEREEKFTTSGYARALDTVAYLAREQDKKDAVRELLLANVNSKKARVQVAALSGLGTLGDAKAMAVLEKFASAAKESPERRAAERALTALRENRKSPVELGNLRNEVLTLQKENRDIRREFDELKRRFESLTPTTPSLAKTNKPAGSPRASR
jgi:aminopeptidase N